MEQQPRLPLWFLPANMALIAAAFFLGVQLGGRRAADIPEPQRTALDLVHREILRSHVEPHAAGALVDAAITGMVRSLKDPYSLYVPPGDVKQYEENNTGHYEGIGAEFHPYDQALVLWFPLPQSPAEAAGLQPGDRLLAVDGHELDTRDLRDRYAERVRGAADTDVRLRVRRGEATLDIVVRRSDVQRPCVKWAHLVAPDIGYVHLTDFHPGASQLLLAAIASLQQPRPLRGLVLDLRFDGGGSLDECIQIARMFIAKGTIVSQQRRDSEIERHEARAADCLHPDLPLVVLVNEFSASASEVLAGALQDHGRAAIVGVRTHGKACVNTVYTWKDLDFRLKLTTGRYRTPSGRDIERNFVTTAVDGRANGGIPPDVEAPTTKEQSDAIQLALARSEVPARWREQFAAVAAQYAFTVPAPPNAAEDPQLAAAVATLRRRIDAAAATVPADK